MKWSAWIGFLKRMSVGALVLGLGLGVSQAQQGAAVAFGPDNPLYAPSALPFHAPPFDRIKAEHEHRIVAVIIPELIDKNWVQSLLHMHRAMWLRRALLKRGDFRVVVIDLPWFVQIPHATGTPIRSAAAAVSNVLSAFAPAADTNVG